MRIILLLIACCLLSTMAWAQTTVTFKDGKTITGQLIKQTKSFIKLNVSGVETTYLSSEIQSVKTKALPPPKPPAPLNEIEQSRLIKISGRVIFPDYQQNPIYITAFDGDKQKSRRALGRTTLRGPGEFSFFLPAGTKQIFLQGANDSNNDNIYDDKDTYFYAKEDFRNPSIIENVNLTNIILLPHKLAAE